MKSKVAGVILGSLLSLALAGTAFAADDSVTLTVNGKTLLSDVPPVIRESRTLVPIRVISESLGADVKWDQTKQKVSIVKNSKVLELTINSKQILSDGTKLMTLDVAPQLIKNRTMVPIRVVSEALGAKVEWYGETRTVATTIYEKREGMTPEDLLLQANQVMAKYDTYKFNGTGVIDMSSSGLPESMTTKTNLTGSFKKSGMISEVYQLQTMDLPAVPGQGPTTMKTELYSNGTDFYTKLQGQDWQKLNLGIDLSKYLETQNPKQALEMMKDFGLILCYGNDKVIDGKDCYTLVVKIDAPKYLQTIKDLTSQMVRTTDPETKKVFDELMNGLKFDMTEKLYIQKDNLMMTKIDIYGRMSMMIQQVPVNQDINFQINLSGFGEPVTMPQVNK